MRQAFLQRYVGPVLEDTSRTVLTQPVSLTQQTLLNGIRYLIQRRIGHGAGEYLLDRIELAVDPVNRI